jgi:DNA-binding NtrC family response regulator
VSTKPTVLESPGFERTESRHYGQEPTAVNLGSELVPTLSVSPVEEDHDALERLLSRKNWRIQRANSLISGAAKLRQSRVPVVVCERDLLPGSWREMLAETARLAFPPFLIVTSRLADERLWAEALNVGAYDVLAKPFDAKEVVRVVSLAWLHWKDRYRLNPTKAAKVMAAC